MNGQIESLAASLAGGFAGREQAKLDVAMAFEPTFPG
jgi:hypothetical protein